MRLDKYLAKCGQGSRSQAKKVIRAGKVTVDEEEITDASHNLNPHAAQVAVEGMPLLYREKVYLMLNKPQGVVSATRDQLHPTVVDLMPPQFQHRELFPVGRLDKDTQGLLLITDDGQLSHRLLSPKRHVPKTYLAKVKGQVDDNDVRAFERGIELEDFTTQPAQLEILEAGEESLIRVTIYEGKFHQVKRMFLAVGKEVLDLKRMAMGGLDLDPQLEPGQVRELTAAELDTLQEWR